MLSHRTVLAAGVALVLAATAGAAGIKSGPQVNEAVPGPFHPLNVNGEYAGQKYCLYCANGERAVAMIFARQVTPSLVKLIKEIDSATVNSKGAMGSFVVFLGKQESLESQLKKVVKDSKLKETILSIDNPAGPEGYNVAKNADVTVVLYEKHTVKVNHAFKKGELTEKSAKKVLADLSKLAK
jgi:hypothetical protein